MGMDLKNFVGKRVHFIGAGGCSMSGLARLMQQLGMEVTGSDRTASHKTEALVQAGIPVQIGHEADLVRQANLVVYSAAIAPDNPERAAARELGIPQIERAELLGLLCREHVCPIGVSGTHGKTTVTAMIAQVMCENGLNPTVHVGGGARRHRRLHAAGRPGIFPCARHANSTGRSSNSSPKSP